MPSLNYKIDIRDLLKRFIGVKVNQRIRFPLNVGGFPLSAPRLLALPTEAWRGTEICKRLAENS